MNPFARITNSMFITKFDTFYVNASSSFAKFGHQSFRLPNYNQWLLNYIWFSKETKKLLYSHAKAWACAEAWNSLFNLWISYRPKTHKQYSRDIFVFLFALLVIVAFVYTIRKTPEKLVNRDQTEEWKGWMQVSIMKQKKSPLLCLRNRIFRAQLSIERTTHYTLTMLNF